MIANSPGGTLFKRIGKTQRWVALSSALGILTIGAGIGLLAFAVYLLTRSAALGAAASLSLTILGVRFFALTRVVGRYCERYLGHLGTFRVLTRLRVWLFSELIETDAIRSTEHRRGDIVAGLIDDVDTMQDRLLRVSSPPFVAIGTLAIGVVALLAINPQSAFILAAFFLTSALALPPLLWSHTRELSRELVALRARRLADATELLESLETLKIWGRLDDVATTISTLDRQEASLTRRLSRVRAVLDIAVVALTGLCVLVIVVLLNTATTSLSQLCWITASPLIALASFEALGPVLTAPEHRAHTDAAANRILQIANSSNDNDVSRRLSTSSSSSTVAMPSAPAIELVNVSFAYDGTPPLLDHASLTIPFGTAVAITAPSGTGKSTLVDLFVGLIACDSGSVSIGGLQSEELHTLSRPCIAAVLQNDHVFDTTVRDNLLLGDGEANDQQLRYACSTAGLLPFLEARPDGLSTPIGSNGVLLSGGERQRLLIARALVADSPILILDEATEHLEPELRSQVIDEVFASRQGRTTVVVAHDADAIASVDIVYDIVDGAFVRRDR